MPKLCNSTSCNNPRFSKGYCSYHQNERTDEKWLSKKSKSGIKKSFKPISDKMAQELANYRIVRDKYMEEHEVCEYGTCTALANDLHHKGGRGKNLSNVDLFMAVCRNHHTHIHLNPKESRSIGYLV